MRQQQYEQQNVISRMGGFILGKDYSAKSIHSLNKRLDKHKGANNLAKAFKKAFCCRAEKEPGRVYLVYKKIGEIL